MVRNRTRMDYVVGIKQTLAADIAAAFAGKPHKEIAHTTGLNPAEVSLLVNVKGLERFTVDRLIMILLALGRSVSVSVVA